MSMPVIAVVSLSWQAWIRAPSSGFRVASMSLAKSDASPAEALTFVKPSALAAFARSNESAKSGKNLTATAFASARTASVEVTRKPCAPSSLTLGASMRSGIIKGMTVT